MDEGLHRRLWLSVVMTAVSATRDRTRLAVLFSDRTPSHFEGRSENASMVAKIHVHDARARRDVRISAGDALL